MEYEGEGRTQGGLRNKSRDGISCQMGIILFYHVTSSHRKVKKKVRGRFFATLLDQALNIFIKIREK